MVYGSIYGAARTSVSEGTFNPDYATPSAAMDMVTEGLEIDQKFFDLFVEHDFLEAAACDNVALESTLMAVDESFLGDVWQKIREFLKKIKDKIVSIVKAASVKIGAFFKRDNEGLVSKYEAQFKAADKSNITLKGFYIPKDNPTGDLNINVYQEKFKEIGVGTAWTGSDAKAENKRLDKLQKDCSSTKLVKMYAPASCVSDSGKIDWKKLYFKEPKDVKASDSGIADHIKSSLVNYQSSIDGLKNAQNDFIKEIDAMDQQAEQSQNSVIKSIGEGDGSDDKRSVESKKASVAKDICTALNTAVGRIFSALIEGTKFNMKQCRAAYIKIASTGAPHAKNESAELLEAVIEADAYEVDSFFDQFSYDYDELTA